MAYKSCAGRGMPYDPKRHDVWGWSLAMKGATNTEIAQVFGITLRALDKWFWTTNEDGEKVRTSLWDAIQEGRHDADSKVERALFERCLGFTQRERKVRIKDGEVISEEVTEKQVPPDTMAIMYWLNNRSRISGEWRQRQEIALSNNSSKDDVIVYLPKQDGAELTDELKAELELLTGRNTGGENSGELETSTGNGSI